MEKLVDAAPGVARSRARWDTGIIDIWLEADAQADHEAILDAISRSNFTHGERLR